MISHKYKYIFIHIPKCAGSSIERMLLCHEHVTCDWDHKFPLKTLSNKDKHEYKLDINSQHHVSLDSFPIKTQQDYFCFTVVRNPWSKIVSSWLYHKKIKKYPHDLKQFITSKSIGYKMDQVAPYHLDLQSSYINNNMDVVCRFETIAHDFKQVQKKLNINTHLPHDNKTNQKHYSEYYDDETKQIVAERYAKDIELFGYKFGE